MKKVKKSTVNTRFLHLFTWISLNLVYYTIYSYILQYQFRYSVMKTKYRTNITNSAYIIGCISFLLPAMIMVIG